MKRSIDRTLTTHVGSLPRPQAFLDATPRPGEPQIVDDATWQRILQQSVVETVRKEAETGIDVISDGEFGKSNWQAYIMERISGFEARPVPPHKWSYIGRDLETFSDFYRESRPELFKQRTRWTCIGPITYDATQVTRDIANFRRALQGQCVEEAFMPVIAPGSVALDDENLYYPDDAAYVHAVAEALKHEYRAIIDAGFLLQVDDAVLANVHDIMSVDGEDNYLRWAESRIEALNYALEGIPEDKVRYHICWGSWHGPHTTDVPLRTIVNIILKAKTQAYSIEAANPRHEHEFEVWNDVRLPDG
ncbi:MAG TPA: epoxyalkane--coenzyme M transferase, partial [Chloroflexota bacterium]